MGECIFCKTRCLSSINVMVDRKCFVGALHLILSFIRNAFSTRQRLPINRCAAKPGDFWRIQQQVCDDQRARLEINNGDP